MTDPTPDPIGEWLAAAEAATPGPWVYDGASIIWTGLTREELTRADDLLEVGNEVAAGDILDRGGSLFSGDPERDEDAEFIAASRNVVPAVAALADEFRALRADWAAANARANSNFEEALFAMSCRDSALAEVAVLREREAAVRALHYRVGPRFAALNIPFCHECNADWPCPTIAALSGPSGQPNEGPTP